MSYVNTEMLERCQSRGKPRDQNSVQIVGGRDMSNIEMTIVERIEKGSNDGSASQNCTTSLSDGGR